MKLYWANRKNSLNRAFHFSGLTDACWCLNDLGRKKLSLRRSLSDFQTPAANTLQRPFEITASRLLFYMIAFACSSRKRTGLGSGPQLGCHQARNQLGTPGGAKSFLGGAHIFKLRPTYFSKGRRECRGTLECHLQYPLVPRAKTFFNISMIIHIQNVDKPQTTLLSLPLGATSYISFVGCRKSKNVGNHLARVTVSPELWCYNLRAETNTKNWRKSRI